MNSTRNLSRVFMAAFVLLAACGTSGTMNLTNDDNNRSISLKQGETFEVALRANHTTGYQWMRQDSTSAVVEQYQPARYELDPAPEGKVGVGGIEHWSFRAKAVGKDTLRLAYRRPWEKGEASSSEEAFTLIVTVK